MTTRNAPRLLRGGSWASRGCPAAYRCRSHPADTYYCFGFRMVCLPGEASTESRYRSLRGDSPSYREFREPDLAQDYTGFRVICLPPT